MSYEADALLARAYALENPAQSKALYRDWAVTYDKTMPDGLGYITPRKTADILDSSFDVKSSRVLDVGAGTGLAGLELSKRGWVNLEALDYSAEMLAVAQARGIYQRMIQADLTNPLPIEDNVYDAQICTGTFTHAHVCADCLGELLRILRSGGVMACTIQKDVFSSLGFSEKLAELEKASAIKILHMERGAYFRDGAPDEGWYFLWRKDIS